MKGKTAYLGDEYSYSHAAAERMALGELKAFPTMTATLDAVGGDCVAAVVPVENNVEGAVNEVFDTLPGSGLYIARQLVLPVRHSLIASAGASLDGIKRVTSHPQAIAQCRKFLTELNVPVAATSSTSAALKEVSLTTAAIAFAPRDGQQVIARNIQDSALNATRFALLTTHRSTDGGTVSVSFDLKNSPGALVGVLQAVYERGVNLTRILSRPHRDGSGKYRFFIDFDYADGDAELSAFLYSIKAHCSELTFLGRYDVTTATDF